ncbi:hypothetical protein [Vibrio parahaemolyticus]|uniref:hypothetical protein n=1 Tax=Vibrio parahaemolyticus TaxID=670 RepID=UPI002878C7D5|nr:hypothetical protein [Vibrio parahaemolyticus]MDS1995212.1 hypothetical protein [Vibrio parahaemolyticus]
MAITSGFQADVTGSVPAVRFSSRFKTLIPQHTPDIRQSVPFFLVHRGFPGKAAFIFKKK